MDPETTQACMYALPVQTGKVGADIDLSNTIAAFRFLTPMRLSAHCNPKR
jgi:hypothetical protein